MTTLLRALRARFADRPDSEHGQAIVRLSLILVIVSYATLVGPDSPEQARAFTWFYVAFGVEAIVGLAILGAIAIQPGVSHARRAVGMVSDFTCMATAMYLLGGLMAPMYVVMMWVTIGNGMRFGTRYLLVAAVMATTSFGVVALTSPFWQTIPYLAAGLSLGLVVIPAYQQSLLRALTRATEEAQRSSRAKSMFLANMSHELRTPLNGIAGMTQLLATTQLNREQSEYTEVVRASANALLSLVDDVLDIASIEAGKLKITTCDFSPRELLESIHLMMSPRAEAKGLTFELAVANDVPERVHGDQVHLRQILINLVNNAIEFTERGRVGLFARSGRDSGTHVRRDTGDWVTFSVSDTGIGIPAEARGRIFNAFEQVNNEPTRKHGGTGLGTAIAKSLAKAMGGDLDFSSVPGEGTSFWLEVPLLPPFVAASEAMCPERAGTQISSLHDPFRKHRAIVKPMRVLVGDDHATNRMVLSRLLEKAGHTVVEADGGQQVLEHLADAEFDIVLVDLHMPGTSGLDVLKEARFQQVGSGPKTPIVVVSADVTPEAMQSAAGAGARAFLPKPVVATRLLQTLAEVVMEAKADHPDRSSVPAPLRFNAAIIDQLRDPRIGSTFLQGFIVQSRADLDAQLFTLRRAIGNQDWRQWREICHAVKGLAGALGLERAAIIAHEAMFFDPKSLAVDAPRVERTLLEEVKLGYVELSAYAQTLAPAQV